MKNLKYKKLNIKTRNLLFMILIECFVFAFIFIPSSTQAKIPTIQTNSASLVSKDIIQLNGFINSTKADAPVKYWFEWGQTNSLGNFTYPTTIYTAFPQNISARINVPDPNALYYFRAAAQNSQGINFGNIFTFRIPRELLTPAPNSGFQPASGQVLTAPAPIGQSSNIQASSPISISPEVANLSFPNGTKFITGGEAGDTFEFSFTVTNTSNRTLNDLNVKNKLSIFLEFLNASENYTFNKPENEISWTISRLPKKQSINFIIQAKGKKFSENIVVENIITVSGQNFSSESPQTKILLNNSPLLLNIRAKNEKIFVGGTAEYEIYYKNESEASLKNVSLWVTIPEGMDFMESSEKFSQKDNILILEIEEILPKQEKWINLILSTNEKAEEKKSLIVITTAGYAKNLTEEKEIVGSSAANIIDPELANLAAAIFGNQENLPSTFLILTLISLIIIAVGPGAYYYNLSKKMEKEMESLKEKIDILEDKEEISEEKAEEKEANKQETEKIPEKEYLVAD